jgi:hypothetical protein
MHQVLYTLFLSLISYHIGWSRGFFTLILSFLYWTLVLLWFSVVEMAFVLLSGLRVHGSLIFHSLLPFWVSFDMVECMHDRDDGLDRMQDG